MKRLALALAALAPAFFACVTAPAADVTGGPSGWDWGKPPPQGNTPPAVQFQGTTDGGATFTAGGSIPDTPTDIFFTDDSTGFAVTRGSAGGAVYRTTDGGGTWFQRTTDAQGLNGVLFPNAATGYAVGAANAVLKTTDGGESWNPKPVPDTIPAGDCLSLRSAPPAPLVIPTPSGDRVRPTAYRRAAYTPLHPPA